MKLFVENTSLFSVVQNINRPSTDFDLDLSDIKEWTFLRNISLNVDFTKQAKQAIFARKTQKLSYPLLVSNNNTAHKLLSQKHLGLTLDFRLLFRKNYCENFNDVDIAYSDLIQRITQVINKIAPFKQIKIKSYPTIGLMVRF